MSWQKQPRLSPRNEAYTLIGRHSSLSKKHHNFSPGLAPKQAELIFFPCRLPPAAAQLLAEQMLPPVWLLLPWPQLSSVEGKWNFCLSWQGNRCISGGLHSFLACAALKTKLSKVCNGLWYWDLWLVEGTVPEVGELQCSSFAASLLPAIKMNTGNPLGFPPGAAKFPEVTWSLFQKLQSKSF